MVTKVSARMVGRVAALAVCLWASQAIASVYTEAGSGDLSGDRLAPTIIPVTAGSNTVTATSVAGDLEYFRFTVPSGSRLTAINVVSSTSASVSFLAIQTGATFTQPPSGTVTAQLLGYAHFGPGSGTVGTDILDNLGTASGAMGFVPPLPDGNYVFWAQETGGAVTYTLDFVISPLPPAVPVPRAGIAMLAIGLALLGGVFLRAGSRTVRTATA